MQGPVSSSPLRGEDTGEGERRHYPLSLTLSHQGREGLTAKITNGHSISCWSVTIGQLGRHDQALAAYEQALALKPDYHLAWKNRGDCLEKLGRQEEAQVAYEQVALHAVDPDLLRRVADLLEARGALLAAAQARIRAAGMEDKKRAAQ